MTEPYDLRTSEEILAGCDDEGFVECLVAISSNHVLQGPTWLFEPWVLQRLARIKARQPTIYLGKLLPGLRQIKGVWVPDLERELCKIPVEFDETSRSWPTPTRWSDMRQREYPARRWLVKGLIPDGLTIIGGAPKVAKSYVAYDLALATVGQGLALGHFGCERGPAMYLAIEDDERESKNRILEVRPHMPGCDELYFLNTTDVPTFTQGLYEYVRHIVQTYQLGLVIIDPLMYVYDVPTSKTDSFREVKDALLPFRQLAIEMQFSLIFVDHRRKESKDDVDIFTTLYGSQAKVAIADSLIMVERHEEEVTFHCKGRSIKEQKLHFTFVRDEDTGTFTWAFSGEGQMHTSGALRRQVLDAFVEAEAKGQRALSPRDVLDFSGEAPATSTYNNIRQVMFQLYKKGVLLRTDRGLFTRANDDDDRGVQI